MVSFDRRTLFLYELQAQQGSETIQNKTVISSLLESNRYAVELDVTTLSQEFTRFDNNGRQSREDIPQSYNPNGQSASDAGVLTSIPASFP
jgi:hypothetical protein